MVDIVHVDCIVCFEAFDNLFECDREDRDIRWITDTIMGPDDSGLHCLDSTAVCDTPW